MIPRATLNRVDRPTANGKTGPIHANVEDATGDEYEVVLKLSVRCEEHEINLAREAFAACLAYDLELPVPQPWIVDIPPDLVRSVSHPEMAERLRTSLPVAFGSTRARSFVAWNIGHHVTDIMLPTAAGVLLFDAIIQNADRRDGNPNCLICGDDLRIIDHELAFSDAKLIVGPPPPWQMGGMGWLETPGNHIFIKSLRGRIIDWEPIRRRWVTLQDARLREYEDAIPAEWAAAGNEIRNAAAVVSSARENIDACIAELSRVLR